MKKAKEHPRIFFVEDDEYDRAQVEAILLRRQCRVISYSMGGEAFDFYSTNHDFDLVILDVHLPQRDAPDIIRLIKRITPDMPIILVCGICDSPLVTECQQLGVSAFFTKPFQAKLLLEQINLLVGRK